MTTSNGISSGEFSAIVFIMYVSYIGTISASAVGKNYSDAIIAAILSAVTVVLLLYPLLRTEGIHHLYPRSRFMMVIYLLYFMYSAVMSIAPLIHMMHNTVFSQLNSYVFSLIFTGAALYCARLGTATAARCAQISAGVLAVCGVLIVTASVKHVEFTNLRIPFDDGHAGAVEAFWQQFGGSMFLPQCLFIIDEVNTKEHRSNIAAKASLAVVLAGTVCAGFIALSALCLGEFAKTQEFPLFTLASYLDLPPLQRLDVILMICLFASRLVKLAVTLIAIRKCIREISGVSSGKFMIPVFLFVSLASAFISNFPLIIDEFCLPQIIAAAGIFLGCVLAYSVFYAAKRKGKGRRDENA